MLETGFNTERCFICTKWFVCDYRLDTVQDIAPIPCTDGKDHMVCLDCFIQSKKASDHITIILPLYVVAYLDTVHSFKDCHLKPVPWCIVHSTHDRYLAHRLCTHLQDKARENAQSRQHIYRLHTYIDGIRDTSYEDTAERILSQSTGLNEALKFCRITYRVQGEICTIQCADIELAHCLSVISQYVCFEEIVHVVRTDAWSQVISSFIR